jgi:BASS family bile acid:Na+ symporter
MKLKHHIKSFVLPIAILLGFFFHRYIVVLQPTLPFLIFLMLYFSFNALNVKSIRFTKFDLWLLLFQIVASTTIYLIIYPFDAIVAQGAFVTILAPTASAAVAVTLILEANIGMVTTYLIACNVMVSVVAPIAFTIIGTDSGLGFFESFIVIFLKVFPLLVAPVILAWLTQRFLPKMNSYINNHKGMSFYLWAIALTIVLAQSIGLLMTQFNEHRVMFLCMFVVSALLCWMQFWVGHIIGRRYGDRIAGGQSLGQKKYSVGNMDGAELSKPYE